MRYRQISARQALEIFEEAEASIRAGNWAKYGEKLNELKNIKKMIGNVE